MHEPRRILVVRLATLGDMLLATPALRALRARFPEAYIGVLTTPRSAPVLRGLDSFDEILHFDKFAFDRPRDAIRRGPAAVRLTSELRAGRWDTLVLLHHLTTAFGVAKYAALSLACGARQRVGLDNGRGRWFLTAGAEDRGFGWRHEVDYALDVVRLLGAEHPGPGRPRPELVVAPDDDGWAGARWAELGLGRAALLVPGSGAFSTARRWAPERFVAVGRALTGRYGLTPLVLSGVDADEQVLARRIAAEIGPAARVAPPAPGPQSLGALIRRCDLVVGNDSGPLHVASAVGTPVVAIFGPSNDRAWAPYPTDEPRHQVVRETLACAPCIHRGHDFGTPQGCPARTCLAILEVPAVLAAVARALDAVPQESRA
jgi:heptosyltransferase-2